MTSSTSQAPRFIDIGSNLGDPVFQGLYRGKRHHENDFDDILKRAAAASVEKQILTGGSLSGSRKVLELARKHDELYSTAGCHPCHAKDFLSGADAYLKSFDDLIGADQKGSKRIVAIGECGLVDLATKYSLPLFLHCRTPEAHVDFVRIIRDHEAKHGTLIRKGVVHSFTGTIAEMEELVGMGFAIGVNGCSLKTHENLEVVRAIPLDKMMLETDCPYCDVRASHASHTYLTSLPPNSPYLPPSIKKERHAVGDGKIVKSRNEPCTIGQIAWIVAKLKGVELAVVAEASWKATVEMFQLE